jgi:hypothetical protein
MTTEPITLTLTLKELQHIEKYIEVNDDTLSVLMKIEDAYPPQKSSVEKAYRDAYGYYPDMEHNMNSFSIFQKGYEAALSKSNKVVDDKPEFAFKEGTPPSESPPSEFRQKLFDGIKSVFYDPEYERTHWSVKVNMAVDEVLTHFQDVIPASQEPVYDNFDKGWNCCLTSIKTCMEHTND